MNKEKISKWFNETFLPWLKETGKKTIKTMAQSAIGAIGTTTAVLSEVNWEIVGGTVGLSGLMCILMAIASIKTTNTESEE